MFADGTTGREDVFEFANGLRDLLNDLTAGQTPLHPDQITLSGEAAGIRYEVVLRWCREEDQAVRLYANGELIPHGGTPISGLRAAVTRSLNELVRTRLPAVAVLKGEEARRGLAAVVSVRLTEPMFEGSTRSRLANPEAEAVLASGVGTALRNWLSSKPDLVNEIVRAAITCRDEVDAFRAERRDRVRPGDE